MTCCEYGSGFLSESSSDTLGLAPKMFEVVLRSNEGYNNHAWKKSPEGEIWGFFTVCLDCFSLWMHASQESNFQISGYMS